MKERQQKEKIDRLETKVNVLNEIAPLSEVLVWGEPGCEALLGQLLPKSKSLFFSYYDVPAARAEFSNMQGILEKGGAKVIRIKDAYADILENIEIQEAPGSIAKLKELLLAKADNLFETFRQIKEEELKADNVGLTPEQVYQEVRKGIVQVLDEDVKKYGEDVALKLNYALSLSAEDPMANIVYARDQSNAVGDKIVLSVMRWGIRKPEVEIYRQALKFLGFESSLVEVDAGTIEGGDTIIFGDTCYIGVGARTTMDAVLAVYKKIGEGFKEKGIKIVAVVNEDHALEAPRLSDPSKEHMQVMHLDTFWTPIDEQTVLAYGEEVAKRKVYQIGQVDGGEPFAKDIGLFADFLAEKGIEIIDVTSEEQESYATNLLNIGSGTVIVPLSKNMRVTEELRRRGVNVVPAEIFKLVGGYGAVHCMTASIKRG